MLNIYVFFLNRSGGVVSSHIGLCVSSRVMWVSVCVKLGITVDCACRPESFRILCLEPSNEELCLCGVK